MRYRRSATRVQRVMAGLMAVVYLALTVWLYPEIVGVISPAVEDTFSEWVWDLSGWLFWPITVFHGLAGLAFVWSSGHFVEGRIRRRLQERQAASDHAGGLSGRDGAG